MSDYIKRRDAMMVLGASRELTDGMRSVLMIPRADVVEVVRCKDCDFWNKDENILGGICDEWSDFEDGLSRYTSGDDYCSLGERKEK
ncbi:MAG: hypothetical protein IJL97_03830 [Lachnospiraceae bacterium]|nr:hypothetical protein [Clostridia bacterium]MBR0085661.1 hypothetical protein [Lachnospiraceae bacterium]